jgi:DNA-nicking Smr family endonuclease
MKESIENPVRCIYCGLWVDLEDGKNLVRMDAAGWLMAAHPQCLAQHRPDAHGDGDGAI